MPKLKKFVLEYKASLIAVKQRLQKDYDLFVVWFIKNIQPISVGV